MKRRRLITIDEAVPTTKQHKAPCQDCPFSRESLPGWLGGISIPNWLSATAGEIKLDCHTLKGPQCAGAAIYRANCGKLPRDRELLRLPADRVTVFANPMEFVAHHERGPDVTEVLDELENEE